MSNEKTTGFHKNRDHAPIDSEIYALLDSIKATYVIKDGIVTVTTKYGDVWDFTEPKQLQECDFPVTPPSFPNDPIPKLVTCNRCGWVHTAMTREKAQESIDEFNNWFAKQPVATKEMYGTKTGSSMDDYDRCFACGFGATFRPFKAGDCPDGCTIQPTIYEEKDNGTEG